jgi:hypothetical protein
VALPTTISSLSSPCGPFKSSGGNFYILGVSTSGTVSFVAQKATDPTTSFTQVDTEATGTASAATMQAVQDGDVIHIIGWSYTGESLTVYAQFDMSTDSFGTAQTVSSVSVVAIVGVTRTASIAEVRSNGEVVVLHPIANDSVMGTARARLGCTVRSAGGTWGSATAVTDATATLHFNQAQAAKGASDRIHFFWADTSAAGTYHRSLNSSNVLATAAAKSTTVGSPTDAVYTSVGGVTRPYLATTNNVVAYVVSGVLEILTIPGSAAGSSGEDQRLTNDYDGSTHNLWQVYLKTTDSDLYALKSTNGSASWTAEVAIFTGTVSGSNVVSVGEVYLRGGNYVIPYVFYDTSASTYKYNEYIARAAGATTYPYTGNGTITFAGGQAYRIDPRQVTKSYTGNGTLLFAGTATTTRPQPVTRPYTGNGTLVFSGGGSHVLDPRQLSFPYTGNGTIVFAGVATTTRPQPVTKPYTGNGTILFSGVAGSAYTQQQVTTAYTGSGTITFGGIAGSFAPLQIVYDYEGNGTVVFSGQATTTQDPRQLAFPYTGGGTIVFGGGNAYVFIPADEEPVVVYPYTGNGTITFGGGQLYDFTQQQVVNAYTGSGTLLFGGQAGEQHPVIQVNGYSGNGTLTLSGQSGENQPSYLYQAYEANGTIVFGGIALTEYVGNRTQSYTGTGGIVFGGEAVATFVTLAPSGGITRPSGGYGLANRPGTVWPPRPEPVVVPEPEPDPVVYGYVGNGVLNFKGSAYREFKRAPVPPVPLPFVDLTPDYALMALMKDDEELLVLLI